MKSHSIPTGSPEVVPASGSSNIVIIDNYDSNTYNIREVLGRQGFASDVYRNDEISPTDLRAINPSHIILGPGPGTPDNPEDVGICPDMLRYSQEHCRALLGICLGQQIMVKEAGGAIIRAPEVMHGKTSPAFLEQQHLAYPSLFKDIDENPIDVMRYHSLMCDRSSASSDLLRTAYAIHLGKSGEQQKIDMAIQHATLPQYGVQFHPESLFTQHGSTMLRNFAHLLGGAKKNTSVTARVEGDVPKEGEAQFPPILEETLRQTLEDTHELEMSEFPCDLPPEEVYARLHAVEGDTYCFESLSPTSEQKQYSYFGFQPRFVLSARNGDFFVNNEQVDREKNSSPLSVLESVYEKLRSSHPQNAKAKEGQLLSGGLVGFSSYESLQYLEEKFPGRTPPDQQTFAFAYFEDGLLYDQEAKKYFYHTRGRDRSDEFSSALAKECNQENPKITPLPDESSPEEFKTNVQTIIQNEILTGNAQQVVVSRRKHYKIDGSMAPLYKRYRKLYPSSNMHAMRIGDVESVGSFPELMMRVQDGKITTIQLAGTRRRGASPEEDAAIFQEMLSDPKEVAEHRMLVDQARNDVGRSSELGSVTVREDELLSRKDAGPVMHIASTIRGTLADGVSPIRAHTHLAPMGTVSGAPKVRATQIIDPLEKGRARGIYSGSIGFFDMTGIAEFVIGLRNIVRRGGLVTIQAGAGIVLDSVPQAEYDETESKMGAPKNVLKPFLTNPEVE